VEAGLRRALGPVSSGSLPPQVDALISAALTESQKWREQARAAVDGYFESALQGVRQDLPRP